MINAASHVRGPDASPVQCNCPVLFVCMSTTQVYGAPYVQKHALMRLAAVHCTPLDNNRNRGSAHKHPVSLLYRL